jgi:hypothetical protein
MYEPTILHQLAKLHGAIRAYQDLGSEIPDRRARLLQSAHELTGTKYRSLGAALSGIEKKVITIRAERRSRRSSSRERPKSTPPNPQAQMKITKLRTNA